MYDTTVIYSDFDNKITGYLSCGSREPSLLFTPEDEQFGQDKLVPDGCYVIFKVSVVNHRKTPVNIYFFVSRAADSCWVSSRNSAGELTINSVGTSEHPEQKVLPTVLNILPAFVAPLEDKYFEFKLKVYKDASPKFYKYLGIRDQQTYRNDLIYRYSVQSFYLGVLVLFCLVSCFMYLSFKERVFIFFGWMTLSFAGYFLTVHQIFDLFIYTQPINREFSLRDFFTANIVFSITFFLIDYVQIKERMPQFYKWLIAITIINGLYAIVGS